MARWRQFERAEPAMAALAFPKPPKHPVALAYLATVRPDGGPRVHPFCPILAGGRLFAAIPRPSPKGDDLRRDPRFVVHALPGPSDAEFSIRGRAREVTSKATRALVVDAVEETGVGGMIESARHDPLFELDIERVDAAHWENLGQPGTYAVRRRWVAPDSS